MVDLKGGQGILVAARDNPQLKLYAGGALHLLEGICDIDEVELCIVQPRREHFDRWSCSTTSLYEWLQSTVAPRAEAIHTQLDKGGSALPLRPGEHCTFCKIAPTCRARAEEAVAAFDDAGDDPLTLAEVAALYPRLKRIKTWAESLLDYAYDQALTGAPIAGYKLVTGRAVRQWSDDSAVAAALHAEGLTDDDIWTRKLIGLGRAEELVGKKHPVFTLTTRSEGKPTLVPDSDPRAEWNPAARAVAAFDD